MNTALVHIWGELAGAVAWDESRGVASFEYDPAFRKLNFDLAPLKMPLISPQRVFSFPELRKPRESEYDTFRGLPGLLADVLPDKYGNQLINAWLARQGRPAGSMNPVELLCFIGKRGMGALEFEPTTFKENVRTFSIEVESLVDLARNMLSKKKQFTTNLDTGEMGMQDILKIGTSAGGARPKAVIAYNQKTGEVRSGQTIAPKGYEHWLIKLDGVSDVQLGATRGYGRVEMAYYNMARACGIDMMPSRLLEENGRAHFMTMRFDREQGDVKHHIQTFCAIRHFDFNEVTSFSYEQLFQTMRELRLSYPEAEQMFRRMVFNVMSRNCDDHTKNFSFRLRKNGRWELAPAYDMCHAYKPGHQWVSQHALSINGKRDRISLKDFLAVAQQISMRNAAEVIDEIESVVLNWDHYAKETGVSAPLRKAIGQTITGRL